MARRPRSLTVRYTRLALADLDQIWESNAERYSADRADRYLDFLRAGILELVEDPHRGRAVPERERYRYIVRKRRSRGAGHVVVYEVIEDRIEILGVFHTSQDWQGKLGREER